MIPWHVLLIPRFVSCLMERLHHGDTEGTEKRPNKNKESNDCAEGTLDCGREAAAFAGVAAATALTLSPESETGDTTAFAKTQSGSFAAAVQSASRIFIHLGAPKAHGNL